MSRKVRITICCVLVVFAFFAGVLAYAQTYGGRVKEANAVGGTPKTYFVDKDGKIEIPAGPNSGNVNTRGTEDNPFFVLEIVPYDGMAEFGYMISGQEPIDVDALARDGGTNPAEAYYYTSTSKTFRFWKDEAPETFPSGDVQTTKQYGVMTRVADGTGKYKRVETTDPEGNAVVKYEPETNGNYSWEPLGIEECLALTDDQKDEYNEIMNPAEAVGTRIKMFFDGEQYVQSTGKVLEHKDIFLRESVGLAYEFDENGVRHAITDEAVIDAKVDAYQTVVYTVTPEDLNLNLGLIDRADMIVISWTAEMVPSGTNLDVLPGDTLRDGSNNIKSEYKLVPYAKKDRFGYEKPEEQYGRKKNMPKNEAGNVTTFNDNPLSWEAVVKIYENNTDPDGICPIVADFKMYNNAKDDNTENVVLRKMGSDGSVVDAGGANGTQNNLVKLFLLSYQMTNPVFEAFYGELSAADGMFEGVPMVGASGYIENKDGSYVTTGKFNYDKNWDASKKVPASNEDMNRSKTYWNSATLLPWQVVPSADLGSFSNYCAAMAPYQVMIQGGTPYNFGATWDTIRNGFLSYMGDNKLGQHFDDIPCGMSDDQYGYEVFDYFDTINGSAARPVTNDLTMADCLNYLLNPNVGPAVNTKVYKILELQPSPVYENEATFWRPLIAAQTGSIKPPVIDPMTTSEFIGSTVDCMAEYDMIYVGINKMADDPTMDFGSEDFVYAHTGPKKTIGNRYRAMYGWLGSHDEARENKFVYSGNDLTELALAKLVQYGQEGFPILFGSGFYESANITSVDKDLVDQNSNVYKLGTTASNRFNQDMLGTVATSRQLKKMLTVNSRKVEMYFADASDSPVLYFRDPSVPGSETYINTGLTDRKLEFKFTVKGPAGSSYKVKLYVDSNTDGVMRSGEEDLSVTVHNLTDGTMSGDTVEAGKTYQVSRTINDRIGSLCWKLVLVQEDGTVEKVFASLSGISAIKADASEYEDIVVLQIEPSSGATLLLPERDFDPTSPSANPSTKAFYEKIQGINGMNLEFVRMKQDEVLDCMNNGYTGEDGTVYPPNEDYLYENFDMLVLGFADCYNGVSDPDLIEAIDRFIDYGKAVLYTHDTSSFIGPSGGDFTSWGKTITQRFREDFGMDRYGALNNLVPGTVTQTIDTPYIAGNYGQIHKNGSKELVQGFTNGTLWRCLYPAESGDPDGNVNATQVSRVNVGAITEYPYNIPEEIAVENTHPQYYQLDMEEDDIVVWYCLKGGTGGSGYENKFFGASPNDVRNNYYIYNKGNVTYSGMGHKLNNGSVTLTEKEVELFVNTFVAAYRAAAKPIQVEITNNDATVDVTGDYYLCVDVDSSNPEEMIETAENDIKGTYKLQEPDTDGTGYMEGSVETKKSKRVYFRLRDNNSYGGAEYSVKLVLNDGTELDGVKVDGVNEMFAVYERNTNAFVDTEDRKYVADGVQEYYVDVPIHVETELSTGKRAVGKTKLNIEVEMTYWVGTKDFHVTSDTEVSILPRGLFDLD